MKQKYKGSFGGFVSKVAHLSLIAFVVAAGFVLFGKSESAHALNTAYYVDATNGSDANDGLTEATAWQTYARAHSVRNTLGAGDQVLFKRGETFAVAANQSFAFTAAGTTGAAGNPILIGAYGSGGKPIINYAGSGTSHAFDFRTDSYITVQDLDIRGFNTTGIAAGNGSINLTLRNLDISSASSTGSGVNILTGANENIELDSVMVQGVSLNGIQIEAVTGLTVSDITTEDNGAVGIHIGNSANVEVSRVTATGNGGVGLAIIGASNSNYVIRDSILNDNGGNGLGISGGGQGILVTNTTANNNFDGFNVHGSWTDVIFERCTANENGTIGSLSSPDGDGFTFHDDSSGIIRYSTAKNNVKTAVAHVGNSKVEMYYNLFTHDTEGELALVYLGDAGAGMNAEFVLANNVIYSAGGVGTGVWARGDSTAAVHNNIVYGFVDGIRTDATTNLTEDYNLANVSNQGFVGFTQGAHSLTGVDPMFVDADASDFRLNAGSPAIDAGMTLSYTTDFASNAVPQGGATDIGAFERTPDSATGHFTGLPDNKHTLGTNTPIIFTVSNKDLAQLTSVAVDGTTLPAASYTAEQGGSGVIITLLPAYLNTLAVGTYSLELSFSDGTSTQGDFVILALSGTGGPGSESSSSNTTDNSDESIPGAPNTGLAGTGTSVLGIIATAVAIMIAGIGIVISGRGFANRRG